MDMKLRQKSSRIHAGESQPQQWNVLYKPQFLTEFNFSGKAPILVMQLADYIRLNHNRILNDDSGIYDEVDTDTINPDYQRSLNCLLINLIGTSICSL